jgi:hypothetical protein
MLCTGWLKKTTDFRVYFNEADTAYNTIDLKTNSV